MEVSQKMIHVQQSIKDQEGQIQDTLNQIAQAEIIHLKTFSRLCYQDASDEQVILKWLKNDSNDWLLEIRKNQGIFTFCETYPTQVNYQTQIGPITFKIRTKQLMIVQEQDRFQIELEYDLSQAEEAFGSYHFQLKFND